MLSGPRFAELEIRWLRALIEAGFRATLLPRRQPIVCRVVSSSRIVVGHDAEVHRCTESPLTPINLRRDSFGHVNRWAGVDQVPTWSWHEDLAKETYPCSDCVYLPTCGGACRGGPAQIYHAHHTMASKDWGSINK
jgi:uncharacterized protein